MRPKLTAACAVVALAVAGLAIAQSGSPSRPAAPSGPEASAPVRATPYLPFDMPALPTDRKVFAHYMPNFPISLDNKPADSDYYTTQYLRPDGEGGIHAAYGGYLRDRPLPRAPLDAADWRDRDLRTEIDQARSVGIDGFAVDIILPRTASDVPARMLAAARTFSDFTVFVTADMAGPLAQLTPAQFAAEFADYLDEPGAFRLGDGRPVLGAFYAEAQPVEWWRQALDQLRTTYRIDAAFVPTFLHADPNLEAFAPISFGFSNWGGRNPASLPTTLAGSTYPVDLIQRSRHLGKIWMQAVAYQDSRPKVGFYEEPQNGRTNRLAWQIATEQHAEWVQLLTWNDYAENTAIAPSVKHGWRLLDLNAYDIATYKYGFEPPVVRDALYVSHRTQPAAARPVYPQTKTMELVPDTTPAQDTVEVVSFATAPSQLTVSAGARQHRCQVPAGMGICSFPLATGMVSAAMWRDGRQVTAVQSPYEVVDAPYVQDLQYVVAGGLR
ncbi:hypothetical protein LV457_05040 [Mycobacterium sp. MYCO198283]|uniref:endo-1,3-alpha-glucanase family glycosylhydrolase n=1 Tax=Mycobacterium sp. MYCO198283 TaxID=2883505 RepID=UPI001E465F2F|nr:endo-1,3-alpha-glucanase family glycosylhydrolase [Mycobacterium sp. MYCO198283]MCG5431657.1 hypothetical protein [Mycobacterium sp. MYCO198283]